MQAPPSMQAPNPLLAPRGGLDTEPGPGCTEPRAHGVGGMRVWEACQQLDTQGQHCS